MKNLGKIHPKIDAKKDTENHEIKDLLTPLQVPIDYVYEVDYLQKTYLNRKIQTIGLRNRFLER